VILKHVVPLLVLLAFAPSIARADQTATEIDFLLSTIGQSDCVFVRNGKEYDAQDAEAHLRMKYRRAKRYAPTTEKFIERLASKSSMSKKPYLIECSDQQRVPSGQWLTDLLFEYRAGK
jgi:hypothetical protein